MSGGGYSCEHVLPIEEEPRHHLIIANDYVRAFAVEIAPRERTLCHHHPNDYFLYVPSGAKIISAARGEEPKHLNYEDGECELSSAGLMHIVENLGDAPFRNVVVELLSGANKLRRGKQPQSGNGSAHIEQLLDEDPGAIFRVQLEPGAEAEVSGPAVLASAHDDKLVLKELDDFDIPLDNFRKLMWVWAPRQVAIKNSGATPGRLIVFQVGLTLAE